MRYNRASMRLSNNSVSILFALLGVLVAVLLSNSILFRRMELDSIDRRFLFRGRGRIDPRLKLVAIDDTSLDRIGKFPWPRGYYASMLQVLSNFAPSCVALDVIFPHSDEESIDDDRTLAGIVNLMKSSLLSYHFLFEETRAVPEEDLPPPLVNVEGDIRLLPPATGVVPPASPYRGIKRLGFINTPKDPDSPLGGGLNYDGVIREIPLLIRFGEKVYPALSLEAVRLGVGAARSDVVVEVGRRVLVRWHDREALEEDLLSLAAGDDGLRQLVGITDSDGLTAQELLDVLKAAGGKKEAGAAARLENLLGKINLDEYEKELEIPVDNRGMMVINYASTYDGFDPLPFEEVLDEFRKYVAGIEPDFDLGRYLDAIMFIGATATGLDSGQIPLGTQSPLVAVHLNAVNTMLTGEFMRVVPFGANLLVSLGLGFLAWFFSFRLPYSRGALLIVAVAVLYIAVVVVVFNAFQVVLGVVMPMLCLICPTMTVTAFRLVVVDREKRQIKRAFSHYVTREIMEEIMRNPAALELGGARKELTVLFSDIRGFTSFCEGRRPEEVVSRLNEYMDEMTEAILNHRGTLDKYVGDEIVAIFGAPRDERSDRRGRDPGMDARNAVMAAIEMRERLAGLHGKWKSLGLEVWEMGIGINTGEMIVGNMGSKKVMDYTVIGDEVNLGARVESLTRTYDAPILITGTTYGYVRDIVRAECMGEVVVKGREKAITVYKVMGLKR